MFKKIMALMSALLIVFGGFLSTSFELNAMGISVNNTFHVDYAEPATDEHSGYFVLMYKDSDSNYRINTFFWTVIPVPTTDNSTNEYLSEMVVTISPNSVTFAPDISSTSLFDWSLCEYTSSDRLMIHRHTDYNILSERAKYTTSYSDIGATIVGYMFSGNIGGVVSSFTSVEVPEMHWAYSLEAETTYSYLKSILNELDSVGSDVSDILSEVEDIYNQNVSMNRKLEDMKALYREMIAEQEKSNSWLEKIFNFLEEKDEKDKEQAQTQGNSSISQGTASIEDKGAGFVDSMGGLVSSMNYSGTDCAWTFPQVKMPAIDGVMEERILIEEQPIDFTRWINAIPAPILLLIQSVLTVGLIVYCFKELYDTISYVLTLRGGGSNE